MTGNVNLCFTVPQYKMLVKSQPPRNRPTSDYAADVAASPTYARPNPAMTQYPPRHITTTLHVSDSTLRRWSEVFARHLSPSATTAPRRYTEQDVAVMTRIKHLSESGMRIVEIDNLLDQVEPLPPTEPPTEPAEPPTTALAAFSTMADTQRQIADTLAGLADLADLAATVADLRERVTRLESAAHKHTGLVRGTPID